MLMEGELGASGEHNTGVGNWGNSEYGRGGRGRYAVEPRLNLLDPVYDPTRLQALRGECEFYLHGHSVGGTNPSLVEMIFFDCKLLCLDVPFNRETAGGTARYFSSVDGLAELVSSAGGSEPQARARLRRRYSAATLAARYLPALRER